MPDSAQTLKDIEILRKQDPTLTVDEARTQSLRNGQLNAQLSSAFGFGTGGQGAQVSNFKFDTATIKNQFGSIGEELSVAFSKSKSTVSESVAFPIDEESITVPTMVPDKSLSTSDSIRSELNGVGDTLSSTFKGMLNQTETLGKNISSVIGGVGAGITSTISDIKSTITAAGQKIAAAASNTSTGSPAAFTANPLASPDQQIAAIKSYATNLNASPTTLPSGISNLFSGFNNTFSKNVPGQRIPNVTSLADTPIVSMTATAKTQGIANIISEESAKLNTVSVSDAVLAAKTSRAQLFPVDQLESKFKSLGNALAPQVNEAKIKLAPQVDSLGGLVPSGVSATPINQAQVDKDVTTLMQQDPTLTSAEARDQATRNQQLNSSLTKAFGFGG